MSTDYKFEGWVGKDASAAQGNMEWEAFEPKKWEETDIDIKVTHAGICATDLHVLRSGWGPTPYPAVVGHEIVGVAVRVGSQATGNIKVGDIVGVGAQADACLSRDGPCDFCESHRENYCPSLVQTYASQHRNGDKSHGGYARYNRTPSEFVFKIPDGLAPELAAPILCAGGTVYNALKQWGAGPGKSVGIVGLGGLGHFALLYAKAMGAKAIVVSRGEGKKLDAEKLGADGFIASETDPDWVKKNASSLDLIVSTTASAKMPIDGYIALLKTGGTLAQVGGPEEPIPISCGALIWGNKRIAGSLIANRQYIVEALQLAADRGITPLVEVRPMADANQALVDMEAGKARYRYVLAN